MNRFGWPLGDQRPTTCTCLGPHRELDRRGLGVASIAVRTDGHGVRPSLQLAEDVAATSRFDPLSTVEFDSVLADLGQRAAADRPEARRPRGGPRPSRPARLRRRPGR